MMPLFQLKDDFQKINSDGQKEDCNKLKFAQWNKRTLEE